MAVIGEASSAAEALTAAQALRPRVVLLDIEQYTTDDPAALLAQARASTMADAQARADDLTRLSNVKRGEVLEVSEVIGSQPAFLGAPRPMSGGGRGGLGERPLRRARGSSVNDIGRIPLLTIQNMCSTIVSRIAL